MLRITTFLIACLTFICLCSDAKADLVLVLDTSNETLHFTGSTSGTSSADASISWETGGFGLAISGGTFDVTFDDFITGGLFVTSSGIFLDVFTESPNEPTSLSADGVFTNGVDLPISYATLNDDEQSFLESQIGSSLVLAAGSGFDDIRIVSAVPEPASAVVLCSAIGLLATRRKRSQTS